MACLADISADISAEHDAFVVTSESSITFDEQVANTQAGWVRAEPSSRMAGIGGDFWLRARVRN